MALQGQVEAKCPKCSAVMETEVWSFIRGDKDEELKESLLTGELNLLVCEECAGVFYADVPVVYSDPASEMLVFSFPESFQAEEARWREKMREDFAQMKQLLADDRSLEAEPVLVFGIEPLRDMLKSDRDMEDEVAVAAYACKKLGLEPLLVRRAFAREKGVPWLLPNHPAKGSKNSKGAKGAKPGKTVEKDSLLKGLEALLEDNDRLSGYRRWPVILKKEKELPPFRR